MMRRLILLILIPYSIALIGCGQSGALYYPKAPSASILEESPPIQKGDSPLEHSQTPKQTQKPTKQTQKPNNR